MGAFFIMSAFAVSFFFRKNPGSKSMIATAERELGKSFLFKAGFTQRVPIEMTHTVEHLDSIETLETGEVRLSFLNGYVLQVQPNSLITVESYAEKNETLVTLARGHLTVQANGRDPNFYVSKEGKKYLGSEFNSVEKEFEFPTAESPALALAKGQSELSEEEINTFLNRQRQSFFRCYTQLLQSQPEAKGTATLNFTIDPAGKVVDSQVHSTELSSPEFQKCLVEVLKRIEFRSFTGGNVSAVFPIRFE